MTIRSANKPDLYRRFAELLVDGGLLSRREVELSLREARRARQPLALWLIRNGRIKPQYLAVVRRIETLLVRHGGSLRLADLLLDTGEISRNEHKRALDYRTRLGQPLVETLVREGWLGRARKPRFSARTLAQPMAAAAMLAIVIFGAWVIGQPGLQPIAPAEAMLRSSNALTLSGDDDLRFVSLGDIAPHLQRLRQRPGPYRKPPMLTGNTRQRVKKLQPLVNEYAKQYALPPSLILAVIEQESSFNPQAISRKRGVGLMQLVPQEGGREAYRYIERKAGMPTLKDLQDPRTNIRLGTAYLRLLLDRHFDDIEDEDTRVAVALAAYNWGPTRMRKLIEQRGVPDSVDDVEALLEKHAPTETRNYVRKITYRMEAFG